MDFLQCLENTGFVMMGCLSRFNLIWFHCHLYTPVEKIQWILGKKFIQARAIMQVVSSGLDSALTKDPGWMFDA